MVTGGQWRSQKYFLGGANGGHLGARSRGEAPWELGGEAPPSQKLTTLL